MLKHIFTEKIKYINKALKIPFQEIITDIISQIYLSPYLNKMKINCFQLPLQNLTVYWNDNIKMFQSENLNYAKEGFRKQE